MSEAGAKYSYVIFETNRICQGIPELVQRSSCILLLFSKTTTQLELQ